MDSILTSIKKVLGIEAEYTQFDPDIIININSAFMALNQLGVGPEGGFSIQDDTETWADYLGEATNLNGVQLYMYLKVRLGFDPPSTAFVLEAMERQIKELEFRLNIEAEKPIPTVEGGTVIG